VARLLTSFGPVIAGTAIGAVTVTAAWAMMVSGNPQAASTAAAPLAGVAEGAAPAQTQPAAADSSVREAISQAHNLSKAFQYAARTVGPAVVHIESLSHVGGGVFRDMWTGQTFRQREGFQPTGLGSGVIVTKDGFILTNNHVVQGAAKLSVKLNDGRSMDGRVVGTDAATDIAVVKIDGANFPTADFADSDRIEVGEWVVAIGSPFGLDNTVTAGIVSAKGRALNPTDYGKYEDFLQTDAAVNPGNSGGPLVTLEGKIVGINTAIASRTGGSVGIGFAIPSSIAQAVMDTLIKTGQVERGWLGVSMMNPAEMQQQGIATKEGVVVKEVIPGSPAERAGLRPGDVLLRYRGRAVDDEHRFITAVALSTPGTRAELDIVRDGRPMTLSVDVGDRNSTLGLSVVTVTPEIAQELGLDQDAQGVFIANVDAGSIANESHLQAGDVIVAVGGRAVTSEKQFYQIISKADLGRGVRLNVVRPSTGERGYVTVKRK
jgi:serine protease Do